MTQANDRISHLIDKYRELQPQYDRFVSKIKNLLENLLSTLSVDYCFIEGRSKTVNSLAEKLNRPGKSYKDPLTEISDLVGLRIVVNYLEDIERVCSIIDEEFRVDRQRSLDKGRELGPDTFGYNSVHKVVTLNKPRYNLPEWKSYSKIVFEIQVRTILQHAWASISHELQYKRENEIPIQFRRKINRLSGLLELADEQFSELHLDQEKFNAEVKILIDDMNFNILIDLISIRKYIAESSRIKKTFNTLASSNLRLVEYYEDKAADLVDLCHALGIQTIEELDRKITSAKGRFKKFFNEFADRYAVEAEMNYLTYVISGDIAHWLTVLLAGLSWENKDLLKRASFSNELYLKTIIKIGKKVFGKITYSK